MDGRMVGALIVLLITINSLAIFINVCMCTYKYNKKNKLFKGNSVGYLLRQNSLQINHMLQN